MYKKNVSFASKHREFVAFMRNMVGTSEQESLLGVMLDNDDAENEMSNELIIEFERLFDDIFDSLD